MKDTIEHSGIILSINDRIAHVQIEQTSACSSCHAKATCGTSDSKERIIDAILTDTDLKPGDNVLVYGAKSLGLKSVLWAFIIPFCLILLSIIIALLCGCTETTAGLIGLCAMLPYYLCLWLFRDRFNRKFQFYVRRLK